MALATLTIDPGAAALTDDQHVDAINAASNQITRASSVTPAARPISAAEVTSTELSGTAARDNLKAMSDSSREILLTRPLSGENRIFALHRLSSGLVEVEYEDVPEV